MALRQASKLQGCGKLQQNQKKLHETKLEQAWMQVSSSFARPWKLEQNSCGRLRDQLRGRPQGPQAYGNWSKTILYDKEGTLFRSSKRNKKQTRKNGPPQKAVSCTSLPVSFNVSVCEHFIFGMQKLSPSFPVDNMQRFPEKYVDNICAAKAE